MVSVSQIVQSFTRTRPPLISASCSIGLIEEVLRDVFSRRIQLDKRLKVVEHLVVDAVNDRAQYLLEQFEIQQQACLVQSVSAQSDADLVVVAVRILTLALVVAKVVSGGKACLHGDFVHRRLPDPVRGSAPRLILVLFVATLTPGALPRLFAMAVNLLEKVAHDPDER